jgi:hypothetical protein
MKKHPLDAGKVQYPCSCGSGQLGKQEIKKKYLASPECTHDGVLGVVDDVVGRDRREQGRALGSML